MDITNQIKSNQSLSLSLFHLLASTKSYLILRLAWLKVPVWWLMVGCKQIDWLFNIKLFHYSWFKWHDGNPKTALQSSEGCVLRCRSSHFARVVCRVVWRLIFRLWFALDVFDKVVSLASRRWRRRCGGGERAEVLLDFADASLQG